MVTEPFHATIRQRQARMPRAAMWAVREAGRVTRRAAAAKAPVLKDRSAPTVRQVRRGLATADRPVRGLLRASVKASRAVREGPATYSVKVGPRGARVHLYAGRQEARFGYMRAGEDAGRAAMAAIAAEAFGKVWRDG
jgi:hypothetical protein